MAENAPTAAKRRGFRSWKNWLLALLLLLCLSPLLAFGLSNLALNSPWVRHWLEAKAQRRCGLPVQIGGASWSPWRGITLTKIEVSQPAELQLAGAEPLLRIDSVSGRPSWRACLKRQLVIRELMIERPRVVISVEMMAHLVQQQAQAAAPAALPATVQPPPVALNPTPTGPPMTPGPDPAASPQPSAGPAAPTAPPTAPAVVAPPPVSAGPPQPTGWLCLRSASFELVKAGVAVPLVRMADLSGEIPISGDAAKSTLRLGRVEAGGQTLLADFVAKLAWQAPALTMEPTNITCQGVALSLIGKVGMLPGLPAVVAVQMPDQAASAALPSGTASVTAKRAAVNSLMQGYLLLPGSWRGELVANASSLLVKQGDVTAEFQSAQCGALLRGGMLSCLDARLLGEEYSLLGNATLLADSRVAGVARLVASPERTTGLVRRWFPGDGALAITPLSTPQRVAFDLSLFGTLQQPQLQLGQAGPILQVTKQ